MLWASFLPCPEQSLLGPARSECDLRVLSGVREACFSVGLSLVCLCWQSACVSRASGEVLGPAFESLGLGEASWPWNDEVYGPEVAHGHHTETPESQERGGHCALRRPPGGGGFAKTPRNRGHQGEGSRGQGEPSWLGSGSEGETAVHRTVICWFTGN